MVGSLKLEQQTHRGSILLVDDEMLVRWSLEKLLQRHGFQVRIATSGREAIELLSTDSFDWLITDLLMPEVDGFQLLQYTHQAHPRTRLILMTAFGSPEVERDAQRLGASYITKPFDLNTLIQKIVIENGILATP